MLTPQQIYNTLSQNPCENLVTYTDPLRGDEKNGRSTPFYMYRVVQFLKHVLYPCFYDTPGVDSIKDTGKSKIGLPFKFLQKLDVEAFTEIQPSIRSGTSHSVRNACDLVRACMLIANDTENLWSHRMSPEYLERFGENSLPDCLMAIGPDIVPNIVASEGRAPSTSQAVPDTFKGMSCLPKDGFGVTGAPRSCMVPPSEGEQPPPQCRSCDFCDSSENGNPDSPCCKYENGSPKYNNLCCKAPMTSRLDFAYFIAPEDIVSIQRPNNTVYFYDIDNIDVLNNLNFESNSTFIGPDRRLEIENIIYDNILINDAIGFRDNTVWIYNGQFPKTKKTSFTQYEYKLRHVGILERKRYGGYANLLDNSGSNFYAIMDDIFLEYFQNLNDWDYTNDQTQADTNSSGIPRMRTISLLLSASANAGRSPVTDTQMMVDNIKDLLWNGYGVLLFSNIGFPNIRDSQGVSYPDRIWYTTYNIIGYDDTKLEFNECVYVLSCPWGDWITGGHPSWGPLPPGCFLVTETHLKCMLNFYPDRDYYGCRNKLPCNPVLRNCDDPNVIKELQGCGSHSPPDKCEPYRCSKQQKSMGLVFALSMNSGFPVQNLKHEEFYPTTIFNELIQERTMYYKY